MKIRYRAFVVTAIVLSFLFLSMISEPGFAEEKKKWETRDVLYATSLNKTEIPDVEGHVLYLLEAKGISFTKDFGAVPNVLKGTLDFIKGNGPVVLYTYLTFSDGSSVTMRHNGQQRGGGPGATGASGGDGSWTFLNGTGKLEGIKGGGTFEWWVVAPGQWYTDNKGEYTLP
jgi:hypothetical protein